VYEDEVYLYVHCVMPRSNGDKMIRAMVAHGGPTLSEDTWRQTFGVSSEEFPGWQHYMVHRPEPWVLMLRRAKYD
jgi:hypothetical protein